MTAAVGVKAGKKPRWKCKQCGKRFDRDKSGIRPIKFCTTQCFHKWQKNRWNAGLFKIGHRPWNKNIKGIHLSPQSQFQKGRKSEKWLPVGSETIRKDKGNNLRYFVKVAESNVWKLRAIISWEKANRRSLPRGFLVHHKDRNSLNDKPSNLKALTRAEHMNEHRAELLEARGILR